MSNLTDKEKAILLARFTTGDIAKINGVKQMEQPQGLITYSQSGSYQGFRIASAKIVVHSFIPICINPEARVITISQGSDTTKLYMYEKQYQQHIEFYNALTGHPALDRGDTEVSEKSSFSALGMFNISDQAKDGEVQAEMPTRWIKARLAVNGRSLPHKLFESLRHILSDIPENVSISTYPISIEIDESEVTVGKGKKTAKILPFSFGRLMDPNYEMLTQLSHEQDGVSLLQTIIDEDLVASRRYFVPLAIHHTLFKGFTGQAYIAHVDDEESNIKI